MTAASGVQGLDRRWEPPPAGFGQCASCSYLQSGSPAGCWACAATTLRAPLGTSQCEICDQLLGSHGDRPTMCRNFWCQRDDRGFDLVWALAPHVGLLREVIARYKYWNDRSWATILGRVLTGYLDDHSPWFEDYDLIVATPGWGSDDRRPDHVGAIVQEAASVGGRRWPFDTDGPGPCVVKTRATVPLMAAGGPAARRLWAACDLRPALAVPDPGRVVGLRLLVVDDVLTDGSTLREVAMVLRRAGAIAVSGLVLARQPW